MNKDLKEKKLNFIYSPELYDFQVNWNARLAKEEAFFKKIIAERNIKKILDVGCGTGHHLQFFYDKILELQSQKQIQNQINVQQQIQSQPQMQSQKQIQIQQQIKPQQELKPRQNEPNFKENEIKEDEIKIVGIDPSKDAIDYAKENIVKSKKICLLVGDFDDVEIKLQKFVFKSGIADQFDLITCLGNTLPILGNRRKVKIALKTTRKLLKKNGIAVFQFLNFEPKIIEKERFYQPKVIKKDEYKYIFLKHFEYGKVKTRADFLIIQLDNNDNLINFFNNSSFLCTLRKNLFLKMVYNAGFKKVEIFGPSGLEDFNKNKHISLLALLYKSL